jgi:membrane protease YdiL (CAAX protease family)
MSTDLLVSQLSEWLGVVAVTMIAGTSERFKRKPLVFLYARRELMYSFGLYAVILALAFAYYYTDKPSLDNLLPRLILAGLSLVPFLLAQRFRKQPIRTIGWSMSMNRLRPALLLGFALAILSIFLRGKVFTLLGGKQTIDLQTLLMFLGIALAEETIFRGYIQLRLVSAWGPWLGVAVTALLFAIWQLPLRLALGFSSEALLIGLGIALVNGLVLGFVMHKSGHVLATAIYRAFSDWISLLM